MTVTNVTPTDLPAGTWEIDPIHSSVEFSARHMMVSKVKGRFTSMSGTITVAEDPLALASSVEATIEAASVDTHDTNRDNHLRSADFFDVERYPTITFRSTNVRVGTGGHVLVGELSIHGVTRTVELDLEHNGTGPDPYGGVRTGFSATTEVNRKDFGLTFSGTIEGTGGAVVGDKVSIALEIEAILKP
ncbi:MAG: YceI family protein [Acidimicrobiales bacterium]